MDEIRRDTAEIIPEAELAQKLERSLKSGTPLRVKQGFDPTRPDLHIGHAVSMRKLRAFQELGHEVIFVVGDYTARVGDPSGRSETRPRLTPEEIEANARTYTDQVGRILDVSRTRIEPNSKWLAPLDLAALLELTSSYTVARMLERDDFAKRYAEGTAISVMEFMYPLMQAYDSVALRADVELGGNDQKFNLLVARTIQERYGQEPQVCLIMPLLRGTDGHAKMSKSYDNYIGIAESADQMFGKTMSIPDTLLDEWYRLSGLPAGRVTEGIALAQTDPYRAKRMLARAIAATYHGEEPAAHAEASFDRVFKQHDLPDDIPEKELSLADLRLRYDAARKTVRILNVLTAAGLVSSNSDGARQIEAGAISYKWPGDIEWTSVTDREASLPVNPALAVIFRKGKRHFLRVIINA
jgi:tyrosyl-tRNA synthetase